MASNKNNIRVGIDIGTSKVVCIIAENTSEGINVIGLGIQNSLGLRDGVIIDIESTVSAVKEAVSKAELMSGKQVTKAHVGICKWVKFFRRSTDQRQKSKNERSR